MPDDAQMEDYKHPMVKRVENEQWYHMLRISAASFWMLFFMYEIRTQLAEYSWA